MKRFLSMVVVLACGVAFAAGKEAKNDPLNAVVKIEATSTVPNFWLPWQNKISQASSGSGVVVGEGLILTNAHNVADCSLLTVRKQNDDTLFVAKVKFVDHDCDLALLTVADPKSSADITPLEFAETPPPQSQVVAAGGKIGVGEPSTVRPQPPGETAEANAEARLFRDQLMKRYREAEDKFAQCGTSTIEHVMAADEVFNACKALLTEAAEWHLLRAPDSKRRQQILSVVFRAGRDVEKLFNKVSQDSEGGTVGAWSSIRDAALLMMVRLDDLFLPPKRLEVWEKLRDGWFFFNGNTVELEGGEGCYPPGQDEYVFGKNPNVFVVEHTVFERSGTFYAMCVVGMRDTSEAYLCRYDAGSRTWNALKKLGNFSSVTLADYGDHTVLTGYSPELKREVMITIRI